MCPSKSEFFVISSLHIIANGPSFLQSSDSNMILNERTALDEHGLATVACLLSGWRIFDPAYAEQSRCLQVLRGLHGFHNYATEYWVEYLLLNTKSASGIDANSKFFVLSCELSNKLKQVAVPPTCGEDENDPALHEDLLVHLRCFSELYEAARTVLLERRVRYLETPDSQNGKCHMT